MFLRRAANGVASSRRAHAFLAALLLGAVLLLVVSPNAPAQPAGQEVDRDAAGTPYVAGELLVTYQSEQAFRAAEQVPPEVGGRVEEELPQVETQVLTFPEIKNRPTERERERLIQQKRAELARDPAVASVSFHYIYRGTAVPNDPLFGRQWGLQKIRAPRAWDRVEGNGVDIAVVDSGIDNDHPDLLGKVGAQRNFVTDPATPVAEDDNGHGTHVAGIAAAQTDNSVGVAGTCPNCRLLIAKSLDAVGNATAADVAQGINWAANNGADVINLSFGAARADVPAVRRAIDSARAKGAVIVAAAGNNDSSVVEYPAAYPNVIAVAATNRFDRRAGFSNFGNWVDVAAPGVGVLSTFPGGGYSSESGTSMSTPHVSGLAGLLAAQGRPAREIRARIQDTAVDLGPDGRDRFYGYGRIDAAAAVSQTAQPPAPPKNTAPQISGLNPDPGSKIRDRTPTIGATVRDSETDLRRSNITLFLDGKKRSFEYNRKGDKLSYRTRNRLSEDRHSIRIVARDEKGRRTTKRWTFRVAVPDRDRPSGGNGPLGTGAPGWPFNLLPGGYPFAVLKIGR